MEDLLALLYGQFTENTLKSLSKDEIKKAIIHIRSVNGCNDRDKFLNVFSELLDMGRFDILNDLITEGKIQKEGSWSDIVKYIWKMNISKKMRKNIIDICSTQLLDDLQSENPSLLAKWCPNEHSDEHEFVLRICSDISKKSRDLKLEIPFSFMINGTKESYRKIISFLREKLQVTERLMSLGRKDEIKDITIANKRKYRFYFKDYEVINKKDDISLVIKKEWWKLVDEKLKLMREKKIKPTYVITDNDEDYMLLTLFCAAVRAAYEWRWKMGKLVGRIYFVKDNKIVTKELFFAKREGKTIKKYELEEIQEQIPISPIKDTMGVSGNVIIFADIKSHKYLKWIPFDRSSIFRNTIFGYEKQIHSMIINHEDLTKENFVKYLFK